MSRTLIAIFENPALDVSKNRAEHVRHSGRRLEYLMRHFATQSGKSAVASSGALAFAAIIYFANESQAQKWQSPSKVGLPGLKLQSAVKKPPDTAFSSSGPSWRAFKRLRTRSCSCVFCIYCSFLIESCTAICIPSSFFEYRQTRAYSRSARVGKFSARSQFGTTAAIRAVQTVD